MTDDLMQYLTRCCDLDESLSSNHSVPPAHSGERRSQREETGEGAEGNYDYRRGIGFVLIQICDRMMCESQIIVKMLVVCVCMSVCTCVCVYG